ncbi:MAG: hypothetical protein ISS35_04385 [Kiritimatiellae bacterium]|nr:hypothetical protein [Kiritimatiellia bacterium]
MSDAIFQIGADGIDTEAIVAEIRATVAQKTKEGVYADSRIGRAERFNLMNFKNEEDFLPFYLDCLKDAVFVDINDFEIYERRARLARPLVVLKKYIWKILKFYTYRLWSQQNQVNGLLLTAVENIETRYRSKISALEKRVAELEQNATGNSGS